MKELFVAMFAMLGFISIVHGEIAQFLASKIQEFHGFVNAVTPLIFLKLFSHLHLLFILTIIFLQSQII